MSSSKYPSDWDNRRRNVYQRDNYTCRNCGQKGGPYGNTELHAHHIKPISQGGSHSYDNLVTLCRACHQEQHSQATSDSGGVIGPILGGFVLIILQHIILPVAAVFGYLYGLVTIGDLFQDIHAIFYVGTMVVFALIVGYAAGHFKKFTIKGYIGLGILAIFGILSNDNEFLASEPTIVEIAAVLIGNLIVITPLLFVLIPRVRQKFNFRLIYSSIKENIQ